MSSSMDAVKRVVDAFERSDWREIDVRSGELRVHLSTTADKTDEPPGAPIGDDGGPAPGTPVPERPADTGPDGDTPAIPDGAHVVLAPSPGIFWRSPEPGAPHFTDIGDDVEPSTTVCIVEVMKLMNHVKAGVAGAVVEVYGHNGVAVVKDEPLFAIAMDPPKP